jgi:hypothetical protein
VKAEEEKKDEATKLGDELLRRLLKTPPKPKTAARLKAAARPKVINGIAPPEGLSFRPIDSETIFDSAGISLAEAQRRSRANRSANRPKAPPPRGSSRRSDDSQR